MEAALSGCRDPPLESGGVAVRREVFSCRCHMWARCITRVVGNWSAVRWLSCVSLLCPQPNSCSPFVTSRSISASQLTVTGAVVCRGVLILHANLKSSISTQLWCCGVRGVRRCVLAVLVPRQLAPALPFGLPCGRSFVLKACGLRRGWLRTSPLAEPRLSVCFYASGLCGR